MVFSFQNEPSVFTHGDYSLTNLLPDDKTKTLYVIDWDEMQWRPRMLNYKEAWDYFGKGRVQCKFRRNQRAESNNISSGVFIDISATLKHAVQLSEVAEYTSLIYWLAVFFVTNTDWGFSYFGNSTTNMKQALY